MSMKSRRRNIVNPSQEKPQRSLLIAVGIMFVSLVCSGALLFARYSLHQDPEDATFWVNWLRNGGLEQRLSAVSVFSAVRQKDPLILNALKEAIKDPSPEVRFRVIMALHDEPSARDTIRQAASDPNPDVRNAAMAVLGGHVVRQP